MQQRAILVAVLVSLLLAPVAPAVAAPDAPPLAAAPSLSVGSSPAGSPATPARSAAISNASTATTAATSTDILLTTTLGLTPDRPGEVAVTLRFDIPDSVVDLETTLAPGAEAVTTDGFTSAGGDTYEWDGDTAAPTISYTLPANRTTTSGRLHPDLADLGAPASRATADASAGEGYLFVDAGPWALVPLPSPGVGWRYRGDRVGLDRRVQTAGSGAVGGRVAFLGDHTVRERTAHGQTFRLVIPAAAEDDLTVSPDAVLSSFADASDTLRVGDRDETVFVVAAPDDVTWAVRGLQTGDADAWVRANEPLDDPQSPWLHEYVHTRQSFATTAETRWVTEGSADYYAALLALQQGRIDFQAFADHLERGSRAPYDDDVLADPSTWSIGTPYRKGSLAAGDLDRRIRLASDGGATFASVFTRLNAESAPVSDARFFDIVATTGDDGVADAARRFTTTTATPGMWTAADHEAAFGMGVARISVDAPDGVDASGPYRNTTLSTPATVAVGETVTVPVTVSNVGDADGDYRVALTVDDGPVAAANGTLTAGSTRTVRLSWTPQQVGSYTVAVRDQTYEIRVSRPATPTVSSLSLNQSRVGVDETVLLTATVVADGDVPADGDVVVELDDERLTAQRVSVAPNESVTLQIPVAVATAGEHTLSVGNATVTLTVERAAAAADSSSTATQSDTDGAATTTPVPGLGVGVAVTALVAATLALAGVSRTRTRRR